MTETNTGLTSIFREEMVYLHIEALNTWSLRSIMSACKKHGLPTQKTEPLQCKVLCEIPVAISILCFLKAQYKFGFVQGWTSKIDQK